MTTRKQPVNVLLAIADAVGPERFAAYQRQIRREQRRTDEEVLAAVYALLELEAEQALLRRDLLWEPPVDPLPDTRATTAAQERRRRAAFDECACYWDEGEALAFALDREALLEREVQRLYRRSYRLARRKLPRWLKDGLLTGDLARTTLQALRAGVLKDEPRAILLYLECREVVENPADGFGKEDTRDRGAQLSDQELERLRAAREEAEEVLEQYLANPDVKATDLEGALVETGQLARDADRDTIAAAIEAFYQNPRLSPPMDHLRQSLTGVQGVREGIGSVDEMVAAYGQGPSPVRLPGTGLKPPRRRAAVKQPAVVSDPPEAPEPAFDMAERIKAWPACPTV